MKRKCMHETIMKNENCDIWKFSPKADTELIMFLVNILLQF